MSLREQQKVESRKRILQSAARLFRKHGFAATGIDAVMEGAGLTAGAFYAHFKSKNDLLGASMQESFGQAWETLTRGVSGSPKEMRHQILARYLSTAHRDQPEKGCPLVGIAAELGRNAKHTAKYTTQYLERLVGRLEGVGLSRQQALAEISKAVGALLLSRLVAGEGLSDEVLKAARG